MLHVELDESTGIAILKPDSALSANDFGSAEKLIDPYIKKAGILNGLIINTQSFPGWESIGSMLKHIQFVKNHHKKIRRVAIATDSLIGDLGEKIAAQFVSAEIKHFKFDEIDNAKSWILATD